MTNPKVTPISEKTETISTPPLVDKAKNTVKQNLKHVMQNPNVKWTANTVRGVIIKGVAVTITQGITGTIEDGLSRRVPKA